MSDFFGTELPVIQAPMAGVQDHRLAAAVSNAGGLGSLPCAMLGADALRAELETLKAATGRPFNVNFFAHRPPVQVEADERKWRRALEPFYQEFGINPDSIESGPGRMPFNEESAGIVEEFCPAVVSFHFGLPEPSLMERVRRTGAKVLSTATTVEEAVWLEQHGVDAIIAQGLEAGGHRGIFLTTDMTTQMGTFALLRQVVAAVKIPVIAAGGIADARGVKAALDLGAVAAQVGTAFLLCREATTRPVHREALKSQNARHTAITNVFSGGPARGIVNRVVRELGPLCREAPPFPLATGAIAPLRTAAEAAGSGDFSPLWCGQNASGCHEGSAAELLERLVP
ncbi:nitronate monooxygenase [Marinobacter gudaonensis]|uniref:Nitronate monooxygenase n=1 Tax=Marinobacter gudaonensis TaxID=375760 RepID=A0A1I6GH11_9GAMM|nr:nitronate monooxygenase [Marinobacter gudaonensis]SFR41430.1 nitronate monooxygenase [Marinobacter gudaonensis]